MNTTRYRLKDLLKIGNGKDHSQLADGMYPVYGSGGLMRYVDKYLYSGESVLLPRKGTLSNIQYVNGSFWTVDTCYYTVINTAYTVPYYLFRLLRSLDLSGLDSGASIPSMTSKCYYGIKVNLPSLPTQRRIASILSTYDELIEKNNRKIAILQEQAQELYKEWFVRFRFPGHEIAKFENGLPVGWEMKSVNECFHISIGKTPPRAESEWFSTNADDVQWVSISDMKQGLYVNQTSEKLTSEAVDRFNMVCLPRDTILLSFKLTVGRVAITNVRCCTNEAIAHFRCASAIREYLYLYLLLFPYAKLGNTSAIGTAINSKIVKKMPIVIPDKIVLCQFNICCKPLFDCVRALSEQNENLTRQRDLLLPRLMSGKLEVQ